MAAVEEESFELQKKRCTELINLRQTLADHNMDPAGVDLAISNVFGSNKGPVIDPMISDGKCLVALMIQLNALGIDTFNVQMALGKAFVPGMSGAYDEGLRRLKELIKMREQMAKMGIPTGCIEATMAGVFRVSQIQDEQEHIADRFSHNPSLQWPSSRKKSMDSMVSSHTYRGRRSSDLRSLMPLLPQSPNRQPQILASRQRSLSHLDR